MLACAHCGARATTLAETCRACGRWGEMRDDGVLEDEAPGMSVAAGELAVRRERRIGTGSEPWDDALSGGLVVPQSLFVYGPPGCRKTTWMAAIADHVAARGRRPGLYLCAEMPTDQAIDTAKRMVPDPRLRFVGIERGATDWYKCVREIGQVKPIVVVYDSIQAFDVGRDPCLSEAAIRAVVREGIRLSAMMRHVAIFISQINAEGRPRCPMSVVHACDTEVRLDRTHIRVRKSRHGMDREVRIDPVETMVP